MKKRRGVMAAALLYTMALLLVLGVAYPALAATEEELLRTRKEIEAGLICQCGCTMVVNVCDCGTAEQIRADIMNKLRQGMTKEAIFAGYVQQYGKEVLAAPPKQGFDLTAWITPFVAIIAGGALLYFLLRRWVVRYGVKRPAPVEEPDLSLADRIKYEGRLEEELKKYY